MPYDEWLRAIGLPGLEQAFGWRRNGYDRLVHFGFGLLAVLPISAALTRHLGIRHAAALYVSVEFVLAGSALYEIFEWLLTLTMAGAQADQYNGQQGDIWDAQKDMACASIGALVSTAILLVRSRRGVSSAGSSTPAIATRRSAPLPRSA